MAIVSQSPSVSEVKAVLAEPSNSVGGLCTSKRINKWAKFKPVRHPTKGDLTESGLASVNHGIEFPRFSDIQDLINFYESGGSWEYLKPRGGASDEWYRLGDFRGYDHQAEKFYYFRDIPEEVHKDKNNIAIRMNQFSNKPNLDWSDFSFGKGLQNAHFGALIVQNFALNEFSQETASHPLDTTNIVDVSFNAIPKTGRYKVMTYIAEVMAGNPINYYPLDGGYLGDFYFNTPELKLGVIVRGYLHKSSNTLKWTLKIKNLGYAQMLYNVTVTMRYNDNKWDDQMELGEAQEFLGDIDISNGYEDSGIFLGMGDFDNRGGYVYFSHSAFDMDNYNTSGGIVLVDKPPLL